MKVFISTILPALAAAATSVSTSAGKINGGRCETAHDTVFFKGIPFGEPPVGDLRFEAPKPYSGKFPEEGLNATASAITCIQFTHDYTPDLPTSEDCLYLDIYAPANVTKDSGLPVKVWIFGGSNTEGSISDSLYDGCNSPNGNSILVTLNYRVGPLGFMALSSAGIQGNQGIQDLLLGLEWVQSNIAAFGGNPNQVLLFGQSAGAENAYVIASLPQAPSLFHSVISESGGGRGLINNETTQKVGASYAQALNCSLTDKSCLKSKTPDELTNAYNDDKFLSEGVGYWGLLGVLGPITHSFYPYADGKIVPEDPYTSGVKVPAVFGSTKNDGIIYSLLWANSSGNIPSPAAYKEFLGKDFGQAASLVEKQYPLSLFESKISASPLLSELSALGMNKTEAAVILAMTTVITDSTYKCPAYYGAAQARLNNIPVWTYEFTHNATCTWINTIPQKYVSLYSATHTAEIPFVFGNMNNFDLPGGNCTYTQNEVHLSQQMRSLWTSMAEHADPSTVGLTWPRFHTDRNLTTSGMIFGDSAVAGTIDYTGCELWSQVHAILAKSK